MDVEREEAKCKLEPSSAPPFHSADLSSAVDDNVFFRSFGREEYPDEGIAFRSIWGVRLEEKQADLLSFGRTRRRPRVEVSSHLVVSPRAQPRQNGTSGLMNPTPECSYSRISSEVSRGNASSKTASISFCRVAFPEVVTAHTPFDVSL